MSVIGLMSDLEAIADRVEIQALKLDLHRGRRQRRVLRCRRIAGCGAWTGGSLLYLSFHPASRRRLQESCHLV